MSINAKLFAGDTSLSSIACDIDTSAIHWNNGLKKISNWTFQWKMSFNPEPIKQFQKVIFSRKLQKISHSSIYLNSNPVKQVSISEASVNDFKHQNKFLRGH